MMAAQTAGKKRAADQEMPEGLGKDSKSNPSKKKPKPLEQVSKFGGMTEEEVCKMLLPDHLKPGLDIVFVSINYYELALDGNYLTLLVSVVSFPT